MGQQRAGWGAEAPTVRTQACMCRVTPCTPLRSCAALAGDLAAASAALAPLLGGAARDLASAQLSSEADDVSVQVGKHVCIQHVYRLSL